MRYALSILGIAVSFLVPSTYSAPRIPHHCLIFDAQLQDFADYWATQFQHASGYRSKVRVFVLNDPQVNAFASVDNTIVLCSGLIAKVKNLEQLLAVLAHEFGHVAGGHIVRSIMAMRSTNIPMMAMALAGMIAGGLTGNIGAGMAALSFGMNAFERSSLKFSRHQEASADAVCAKILNQYGIPLTYAQAMMEELAKMSPTGNQEYESTHPDIQNRIKFFKNQPSLSKPSKITDQQRQDFLVIQAKLKGFLANSSSHIEGAYPNKTTEPGVFAYIMNAYRSSHYDKALNLVQTIKKHDCYTVGLKAELMFYKGDYNQARSLYEQALKDKPNNIVFQLGYAVVLIQGDNKKDHQKALTLLMAINDKDPENGFAWHLRANAAGRIGRPQEVDYCRAQLYFLQDDHDNAKKLAQRALKGLDGVMVQKAQDLIRDLEINKNASS